MGKSPKLKGYFVYNTNVVKSLIRFVDFIKIIRQKSGFISGPGTLDGLQTQAFDKILQAKLIPTTKEPMTKARSTEML